MGQSPFWKAVTGVLTGGTSTITQKALEARQNIEDDRKEAIESGLDAQNKAADDALMYQQNNLDYVKDQNKNLVDIGDQYLQMLRQGIESGAFQGDDSLFKSYQQYVLPEYEQGGKFETAPRDNIVTPDMYQYSQQRQQAPTANQYQDFQQDLGRIESGQLMQDAGAQRYNANPDMQWNQTRQQAQPFDAQKYEPDTFQAPTQEPWTNTTFNGQKYNTDYQTYQGQQAPERRAVNDQFQTENYQQQGNRPDIYRASDAPDAQYYDPTKEQYKSSEFQLENDPVYQRRLELSGRAIEDSAARNGMQLSGATLKALQENAQGIAAEEGQAAYDRWNQQDQTGYDRFQDQQNSVKDAMQFRSADEYQRYLDNAGIRRNEQGQLIQQWESDRQFGADQNKEAFLREQASKQLGRDLNNDEFSQWLQTDGQQYAQFADQRDWSTSQSNLNADRDWQQYTYEKGFGRDVYTDDRNNMQQQAQNSYNINNANRIDARNFAYGANQDQQNRYDTNYQNDFANQLALEGYNQDKNLNAYNVNNANRIDTRNFNAGQQNQQFQNDLSAYGANVGQYNINRQFGADQSQQNFANQFDLWNAGNANFNLDRQFGADQQQQQFGNQFDVWNAQNANRTADNSLNYNAWNQQNQNNFDLYKYNTGMGYQQSVDQYGQLTDAYNRQVANKQNQYATIGDVVNYGMQGRQNNVNAMGSYSDASSDVSLQRGNAYAAASAAKGENTGLIKWLGF